MLQQTTTPEAILTAATSIFIEDGYKQISVSEIADAAHVAVGSIYHHFGDKEGLYAAVAKQLMDELITDHLEPALDGPGSPAQRLMDHGVAYATFAEQRPREFAILTAVSHDGMSGPYARKFSGALTTRVSAHMRQLIELVAEGQLAGEIRRGEPSETAMLLWSSLYGICALSHRFPRQAYAGAVSSLLVPLARRVISGVLYPEAQPLALAA